MKLQALKVDDLVLYHRNPRRGDIKAIAASLAANGQYRPIVVNKGTLTSHPMEVLAGNHTLRAARTLGWKKIEAVVVDVDEQTAGRIVLADNQTQALGDWADLNMLHDILSELPDLTGTGFRDLDEIDDLFVEEGLPAEINLERDMGEGDTQEMVRVPAGRYRLLLTRQEAADLAELLDQYRVTHDGSADGFVGFLVGAVA